MKIIFSLIFSWLTSLLIFPYAINHLTKSERSRQISEKLNLNISDKIDIFVEKILIIFDKFNKNVFYEIKYILPIAIIFLMFITIRSKNKLYLKYYNKISIILLYTFIIFNLLIVYISPYTDLRYLSFTIPIFFILFFSLFKFIKNKKLQIIFIITICLFFIFNLYNKQILYIPKCYKTQNIISEEPKDLMIIDKNEINSLLYYFYMPKNINIYYTNGENKNYKKIKNPDNFYLILNINKNKNKIILDEFKENYEIISQKTRFCSIKALYSLRSK